MGRDAFQDQSGGGGLDNFVFEVTDAYFGISEALNEKASEREGKDVSIMLLHLVGKTDNDDQPVLEHDGFHPSYALTEDWETHDGGKTVTYTGTRKNPRLGKWYGRFIDDVVEMTNDIADTPEDPLGGDADPHTAAIWIGTKWQMEDKKYEWGGDFGTSNKLMPVAYLGRVTTSGATSETAAPSPNQNGTLRDKVVALAKASSDYAAFQTAALNIDGISDEPDLLMEIANKDGGIYASVQA
jgi:hypothetical protein